MQAPPSHPSCAGRARHGRGWGAVGRPPAPVAGEGGARHAQHACPAPRALAAWSGAGPAPAPQLVASLPACSRAGSPHVAFVAFQSRAGRPPPSDHTRAPGGNPWQQQIRTRVGSSRRGRLGRPRAGPRNHSPHEPRHQSTQSQVTKAACGLPPRAPAGGPRPAAARARAWRVGLPASARAPIAARRPPLTTLAPRRGRPPPPPRGPPTPAMSGAAGSGTPPR